MWKKSFSKIGVSQKWRIFEKWETSCPGIKGCFTGVPGCPASPGRVTGSNVMLHMCLCFCGNWSAIQKRNSRMLYCVVRVQKRSNSTSLEPVERMCFRFGTNSEVSYFYLNQRFSFLCFGFSPRLVEVSITIIYCCAGTFSPL